MKKPLLRIFIFVFILFISFFINEVQAQTAAAYLTPVTNSSNLSMYKNARYKNTTLNVANHPGQWTDACSDGNYYYGYFSFPNTKIKMTNITAVDTGKDNTIYMMSRPAAGGTASTALSIRGKNPIFQNSINDYGKRLYLLSTTKHRKFNYI